eukprot:1192918-Prorocentrum_minimum.AAC.3
MPPLVLGLHRGVRIAGHTLGVALAIQQHERGESFLRCLAKGITDCFLQLLQALAQRQRHRDVTVPRLVALAAGHLLDSFERPQGRGSV